MHKLNIPDYIVTRVLKRQGRWNVHDDVPAKQTAFVVVDMQNYFMAPGQQVEIPEAREIVPNVNRLADELRKAGGLVVWIRTISNEDSFKGWSHFHDVLNTPERKARRHEALKDGAFGSQLWPQLAQCRCPCASAGRMWNSSRPTRPCACCTTPSASRTRSVR